MKIWNKFWVGMVLFLGFAGGAPALRAQEVQPGPVITQSAATNEFMGVLLNALRTRPSALERFKDYELGVLSATSKQINSREVVYTAKVSKRQGDVMHGVSEIIIVRYEHGEGEFSAYVYDMSIFDRVPTE